MIVEVEDEVVKVKEKTYENEKNPVEVKTELEDVGKEVVALRRKLWRSRERSSMLRKRL